ncbi:MAG: hypothetical protein M1352_01160 [Patescibacteria group bacterium]|nr:hypothetical protein [Patescibacteria group bacterium]
MPRFLLTFIFLFAASATGLMWEILTTAPSKTSLIIFFILLFILVLSLLSLVFYAVAALRVREPLNRRTRFREDLKASVLLSLLVVVTGILKVSMALNPVNFLLLTLILVVLFLYLKR